jgi:hypothetical protein
VAIDDDSADEGEEADREDKHSDEESDSSIKEDDLGK